MTIREILDDIRSPRRKRVILDCDTHNEMDDQYAVAYSLGETCRLKIIGMTTVHFYDGDGGRKSGMEKSYLEFLRVMDVCGRTGVCPVYRGAEMSMSDDAECRPVISDSSENIVRLVNESDEIVYVVATGPLTNVAAALHTDPSIKENMCVIWLGGNSYEMDSSAECNLWGDVPAANLVLDSGVPFVQLPAYGKDYHGACQLHLTSEDFKEKFIGDSPAVTFFRDTLPLEHHGKPEWEHVLWDVAGPAVLTVPEAYDMKIVSAPCFTSDMKHVFTEGRHEIIYMDRLDPKLILEDMYRVINML